MSRPLRRTFSDPAARDAAWNQTIVGAPEGGLWRIAQTVGDALRGHGFRLFRNGGRPLIERRTGDLLEEILFITGRDEREFGVRFHLSHAGVGEVRERYWRPTAHAPRVIAAGDIGLLELPPVLSIWGVEGGAETAEALRRRILEDVVPWMDVFDEPLILRDRLLRGDLPLVDPSTALELILAEHGVRAARHFLREGSSGPLPRRTGPPLEGLDLQTDRVPTIAAYFRL